MKKNLILFSSLFTLFQSTAQTPYRISFSFNRSNAMITSNGIFFNDQVNMLSAYQPDKFAQMTTIYSMSFAVSAKDINGQDHASVTTFDASDFTCGPVATNYSDPNYTNTYGNILWMVNKNTINQHILNWNTSGYVVPPTIAAWPGSGDVSNGMAAQLAPYTDANGNGIYDPVNGDYPDILGDEAIYLIMNDQNSTKFPATMPLNMELHFMFYQFATADELNKTNFVNVKAYNRSSGTYTDFKLTVFTDFDLGNYSDDFGGTDLARNLSYVYNGDNMDEPIAGRPGYGANPPAMGMLSLNHPLVSSIFPDSIPDPGNEFLNVMNGKQVDGTAITNGGTPTLFHYSDTLNTGYNEVALNHTPADKRNFSSVSLGTFAPNSVKCVDFAWIFARRTTGTSLFESADSLMKVADFVQNFYDNTNHCVDGTLQTESLKSGQFEIYPNPSNGEITCVADQNLELIEVWNMEGRLIQTVRTFEKEAHLNLNSLATGAYLIKLTTSQETKTIPFYKQ